MKTTGIRAYRKEDFPQFTLIELLAVMGVISILAALLLPTLAMAREEARKIDCVNKMKQITIAIVSYGENWELSAPPFLYNSSHLSHADHAYIENRWDGIGILWKDGYLKTGSIFYCKSNDFTSHKNDVGNYVETPPNGTTIMTSYIYRNPSSDEWDGEVEWKNMNWRCSEAAIISDAFGSRENCTAHKNGLNVGYGDGHVTWEKVKKDQQIQEIENKNTHNSSCNATMVRGWVPLDGF